MRISRFLLRAMLALSLGATVGAAVAAGSITVVQRNRAFDQRAIVVERGMAVHFANNDEFVHQLYVDTPGMSFESAEQPPGSAIDVRFATPGRFDVRCRIHPRMILTVDVR